jgi:hypothetical protein
LLRLHGLARHPQGQDQNQRKEENSWHANLLV